jgi:hypothetical protein
MNEQKFNPKHNEADSLRPQLLPTLQQWCKLKSSCTLLEPRSSIVPILLRLTAAGALFLHAPAILVLIWGILVFGTYHWMRSLITAYAALLKKIPDPVVMTDQLTQIL